MRFQIIAVLLLLAGSAWAAEPVPGKFQNPINGGAYLWMTFHAVPLLPHDDAGRRHPDVESTDARGVENRKARDRLEDSDPTRSQGMWAAEFHFITNRWYLYYTATSTITCDTTTACLSPESESERSLGPHTFTRPARESDPKDEQYAIDGTVLQ